MPLAYLLQVKGPLHSAMQSACLLKHHLTPISVLLKGLHSRESTEISPQEWLTDSRDKNDTPPSQKDRGPANILYGVQADIDMERYMLLVVLRRLGKLGSGLLRPGKQRAGHTWQV